MDIAELKARALAAREFAETIGECTFTLRVPTRVEVLQVMGGIGPLQDDAARAMLINHELLCRGLVGWAGPRVRDMLPGIEGASDPLPHSADAVRLLLEAKPEWAATLGNVLAERMRRRNDAIAADAKN